MITPPRTSPASVHMPDCQCSHILYKHYLIADGTTTACSLCRCLKYALPDDDA